MTLEKRIKEFRFNIQLGGFANMLDENSFYCGLLKDASEIIEELQTKLAEMTKCRDNALEMPRKLARENVELNEESQQLFNKNKELTRLEVIDELGRVYVNNNCKMELSYQDEGRTLKIFVNNEDKNIC